MNPRFETLAEQAMVTVPGQLHSAFSLEKFAELIVQDCADYIRSNYDSWDAEPLAFNLEKDYGLHGDYA